MQSFKMLNVFFRRSKSTGRKPKAIKDNNKANVTEKNDLDSIITLAYSPSKVGSSSIKNPSPPKTGSSVVKPSDDKK